ncbi:unnamed protein product [Urochloa decumbens]|uniref:F-box protein n=1 Tax=Urochloa decumbens TaxID=240449 RepID=A0ABC8X3C1_9POAL
MMSRRFLNLVTEFLGDTGVYSLRRINLSCHLFYPSPLAAEATMARTEAAIQADAEMHGPLAPCRSLWHRVGVYVIMGHWLHPDLRDYCFEELRYEGGQDLFSALDLFRGWQSLDWRHAGNWSLPFSCKAEYVPELKLWFGLSASRPFHLCAFDLSAVDFERPPAVVHAWVDLDMPKSWSPFQLDLINLGSGRLCVVKMFRCTRPPFEMEMGFSDEEDSNDDEALGCRDVIHWKFAILTGVEIVGCDGEAAPGKLRMLKHMSKYHIFEDDGVKWVL